MWGAPQAVMIRNHVMLWTLSIGFELMELTFQHLLPNFNECWWDRCVPRFLPSQELANLLACTVCRLRRCMVIESCLTPAPCDWRSWLLDVLICNWLGIWGGMRTVKWFGCALTAGLHQKTTQCLRLALPHLFWLCSHVHVGHFHCLSCITC